MAKRSAVTVGVALAVAALMTGCGGSAAKLSSVANDGQGSKALGREICPGQKKLPVGYLCPAGSEVLADNLDPDAKWKFVSLNRAAKDPNGQDGYELVTQRTALKSSSSINPSTDLSVPGIRQFPGGIESAQPQTSNSHPLSQAGLFQRTAESPNVNVSTGQVKTYFETKDGQDNPLNLNEPVYMEIPVTAISPDGKSGGFSSAYVPIG